MKKRAWTPNRSNSVKNMSQRPGKSSNRAIKNLHLSQISDNSNYLNGQKKLYGFSYNPKENEDFNSFDGDSDEDCKSPHKSL